MRRGLSSRGGASAGGVGLRRAPPLQYARILLEEGRLPLAAEGWSTYHPPLFYAAAALVQGLGGGAASLKALPLLAGLGYRAAA